VDVKVLLIRVPKPAINIILVIMIALPVFTVVAASEGHMAFRSRYSTLNRAR